MSSYITVTNLATGIWSDLDEGSQSSLSPSSIETKILGSGYLGKLDILINGTHYIDYDYINSGFCFEPELYPVEQAIYEQLYLVDHYTKKSTSLFAFMDGQTAGTWTNIKEGDSSITRTNPSDIAKYYKDLSKEARSILDTLVDLYKRNKSNPLSVDYYTITNEGLFNHRTNRYGGSYQ